MWIVPSEKDKFNYLKGTIMEKEYITEITWIKILKFLKSKNNIYIDQVDNCKNFVESIY